MNANAPKLITLSCPSCGAKLEISPDLDRFACAYCGQEHIVNRTGGTISLFPVVNAIHEVKTGVDKTAAELAIVRIQKEIESLKIQKRNLEYHPPESLGCLTLVKLSLIFFGSISVIVGISDIKSSDGFIILLIGITMFVILYVIVTTSKRKAVENQLRWKKTTSQTIIALTNQIDQKITELKSFQDIVSRK